jgi:DNA-binding transcriptional MocR family regulator
VISSGAQNALSVILTSLFLKGDRIAVDELTYTGLKSLAKLLSIILIPVKGGNHGIDIDDLRNTCKRERVKGLYLIPDCHNPTTITMPMDKRAEIAKIVDDYKLILIEDGTFSFCAEEGLKPISSICPGNSIYIHGTSKALSPSFRISYIIAPQKYVKLLKHSINNLTWMPSPLTAEIVSLLQATSKYDEIVKKKLEILKKRNQVTDDILKDFNLLKSETSLFRYLSLPEGFDDVETEQHFLKAGVQVFSEKRFSTGMEHRHNAIRIAISSPENERELVKGLEIIRDVLWSNQNRFEPIV